MSVLWSTDASRQMENDFHEKDESAIVKLNAAYEAVPETEYDSHTGQIENFLSVIEKIPSLCR